MKVITINTSPRKTGNCSRLIEKFINNLNSSIDLVSYSINDLNIEPCHACEYCAYHNGCKIDDDANQILNDLIESDILLFASPIYYGQMTAQAKLITDRFYSISRNPNKNIHGKAYVIFTHALEDGVFEKYIQFTKKGLFDHMGYETETITVGSVSGIGDVENREDKLNYIANIARSL